MLEFKAKDYMEEDAHIHVFKSRIFAKQLPHTHDFFEIVYVTAGKMQQQINGNT